MASRLGEAVAAASGQSSPIVLVDAALPDGLGTVALLREVAPSAQFVALALSESEADVIAWVQAGACGYVPRSTGLNEFADFVGKIMHREQNLFHDHCRRTAALDREAARATGAKAATGHAAALAAREDEVVRLVAAGLSNKEIARRLDIGLATVKSHVHNCSAD